VEQMSKIASSPVIAIIGAGAALANPGGFIPPALKEISETDPSNAEYIVDWVFFFVVSLLPVAIALVLLVVTPKLADRVLQATRIWLLNNVPRSPRPSRFFWRQCCCETESPA